MATWKKLLVSGSDISQLVNDVGYLTAATETSGFVTASVNGVDLLADNTTDTLSFVTGSGTGITLTGTPGTDTITIGSAGIVSGSIQVSYSGLSDIPAGIVSGSSQIDHDQTTNFNADEHFTQANITTVGTVTAGDVSAILPSGVVSGSSISSPNQGTVTLTTNGVAATPVDLGLQIGDSPQFTNLTLSGNLTVQGDTINANVTNLDIEDRFILLNSGSSTIGDSGIVFGGANGIAQQGSAVIWDASYNTNDGRLAVVNSIASNATGDQTPDYHLAGVFEGTEANAATAQADHVGNIRVDSGDIFIYV